MEESAGSSVAVESIKLGKKTPSEEKAKLEEYCLTKGVKVCQEDADFLPDYYLKKKRKTGSRDKGQINVAKRETRANGGVYKPSEKRKSKNMNPNHCQDCRQHLEDPNLRVIYFK